MFRGGAGLAAKAAEKCCEQRSGSLPPLFVRLLCSLVPGKFLGDFTNLQERQAQFPRHSSLLAHPCHLHSGTR